MIELSDCYHVLGVPHTATEKEIKRAYHREALKYHPDKNKDLLANQRFHKINEAFNTLTHGIYHKDANHRTDASKHTTDTANFAKDLFDQLFSDELKSFHYSSETTTTTSTTFDFSSSSSITSTISTTAKSEHSFKHTEQNDFSHYSTLFFDYFPEYQTCAQQHDMSNKRPLYNNVSDTAAIAAKRPRTVGATHLNNLNSPFKNGQGGQKQSNNKTSSTLHCKATTTTTAPSYYVRVGDNLFTTLNITLTEALTGFKKQIPKFNNSCSSSHTAEQFYLIENHHRIIQSGQVDIFYGEGVLNEATGVKGNLIILYQVQAPTYAS